MDENQREDAAEEQNDNETGFGSELQYFSEREASAKLINLICGTVSELDETSGAVKGYKEELDKILLKYLEQPLLISPYVPELVNPLNDILTAAIEERSPDSVRDIS